MSKKKENCRYELLCLLSKKDKEKYENFINDMKEFLGKESIDKIEEKGWKPAYKINKLENGQYVLICFHSLRSQAQELEEKILKTTAPELLNRYLLLNLEEEKRNKIKLNKKDAEQN